MVICCELLLIFIHIWSYELSYLLLYTTCLCTTVNMYFHICHLKWKQIQIIITVFIPIYFVSFICSCNTITLSKICFISKSLVEVDIYLYNLFTPQYGWNTARVGIKHQSIRYYQLDNSPSNTFSPTWYIIIVWLIDLIIGV